MGKRYFAQALCASMILLAGAVAAFASGKKDRGMEQPEELPVAEELVDEEPEEAVPQPAPEVHPVTYNHDEPEGDPVEFHEVWGYVMTGREHQFSASMPITDLCYFSADVNSYGEIPYIPNPSKFKSMGYRGRVHLVVTCTGRALTHMVMEPSFGVRGKVIETIVRASRLYDGVQIDFENVPPRDSKNFCTFLKDIREQLDADKAFTVALAARTRKIADDIYDYASIYPLVDRVIIMAYDEHWSGSAPGSVASMDWCGRVADYCKTVIPAEKLVMGLPFYGRSWQDETYGTAWVFNSVNRILNENEITHVDRDNGVPYFKATIPVEVTGYFEDAYSLVARCRLYRGKGVDRIAFWRVGQEDTTFWQWLVLD